MRKLIAVFFVIALAFGWVAFYDELSALPSLTQVLGLFQKEKPAPEVEDIWPENFSMFPQYTEGGTLTNVSYTNSVMLRIYNNTSREEINKYIALLARRGFENTNNAVRKIEGDKQYTFQYSPASETRFQLTFEIAEAPPLPPLEIMDATWLGAYYNTSYQASLHAEANAEGRVQQVRITANCPNEWVATALAEEFGATYSNVQQDGTTVTAELNTPGGLTFTQIREHFAHVDDFEEHISYIEQTRS